MSRRCSLGLAALALPFALHAQAPAAARSSNPEVQAFQDFGGHYGRLLLAAFDSIPAGRYGFRPTPAQQTVGYIAQHLEAANYSLCAPLANLARPSGAKEALPDSVKATWPKDTLVARLRASLRFCGRAFAQLTDGTLTDSVPVGESAADVERMPRVRALLFFVTDLAQHYSQVASYMRLIGVTPPSALPRTGR